MSRKSQLRVGALVLVALGVLAALVFLVGEQNRLFTSKNDYFITTRGVSGLNEGNPVHLDGVVVGRVERIILPREPEEKLLTIRFSVERRFASRLREDSEARIRTLGLLGDKYIDITSGSPSAPVIEPGGRIPTAKATDVDKLIASGEDVVDNLVAISHSFRNVLERVDEGEGLVGELVSDKEGGRRFADALYETMDSIQRLTTSIEEGEGPISRLVHDRELAEDLARSIEGFESVVSRIDEGEGLLASLVEDPELDADARATVTDLRRAAENVRRWTEEIEANEGLLDRLLTDEELAAELAADLERLVHNLGEVAEKLNRGDGTAARLVNDPSVYEAVQDIIVGVEESRILSWLVRNRQEKGIEVRYEEATGTDEPPPPEGPDGDGDDGGEGPIP